MASGDLLAFIDPAANDSPGGTGWATPAKRNGQTVLNFDATVDESAQFRWFVPPNYTGGGIRAHIILGFASATSNVARMDVQFEKIGSTQDIDADGYATAKSVDVTAQSTSGVARIATIDFTNSEIDGLVASELGRVKITRDANHANDNAAGDAQLMGLVLTEI